VTVDLTLALEELEALEEKVGQLGVEAQRYLLLEVATKLREDVIEQASTNLDVTRGDYLEALTPVTVEGNTARFGLEGSAIAVMLEGGASPYDMRDALLQGQQQRVIRFRSKWPEESPARSRRRGGGRPIDRPYRELLGRQEARRVGRRVLRELKAGQGPIGRGRAPVLKPHHTTDLFHRMRREDPDPGRGRRQAQYAIYRTITMTDTGGWIHPGFEPKDFFGKAEAKIDEIARAALDGLIGGILE